MMTSHNQNIGLTLAMMALMASKMYNQSMVGFEKGGDLTSFKNFCMSNKSRVKRIKQKRRNRR